MAELIPFDDAVKTAPHVKSPKFWSEDIAGYIADLHNQALGMS